MQTGSDYLNVLNHGYFRTAVAIPRVVVANPQENKKRHVELLHGLVGFGVLYVLFPELSLSGYTIDDYAHQEVLLDACRSALQDLVHETKSYGCMATIGAPLRFDGRLFNCAVTFCGGKVIAVTPKSYLPNYREFYEERLYASARDARSRTVSLCGFHDVPFGNDIILKLDRFPDAKIHVEVCEDTWVPVPPSTLAALGGATVLANASASNNTVAKSEYRHALIANHSAKNLAVCLYTSAGSGESSNDLAWDGQGMIYERGELSAETKRFASEAVYAIADVDITAIMQDRMRQNSFADNATDMLHSVSFRSIDVPFYAPRTDKMVYYGLFKTYDPLPFVPSDVALRDTRCKEIYMLQTGALSRRLQALPEHGRKVIIGVSGGRDSTHALLVAVRAFDTLGISRTNIIGCTMPGFGTTDATAGYARTLMEKLGITALEHSIVLNASQTLCDIGHDGTTPDVCFENVQASERTKHLFALAWKHGGMVLGTGDLSEAVVGWCTYGVGDHMSHYGINIGVPKTLIEYLIRWTADTQFESAPEVRQALDAILASPVSPELVPRDGDGAVQKTDDKIGPADLRDFFTYYFFRFGFSPARLCRMAYEVFGKNEHEYAAFGKPCLAYSLPFIKHWLGVFLQRCIANQFKRTCMPNGLKVGTVAVSPRGDFRAPSDIAPDLWLEDLQLVPDIYYDLVYEWRRMVYVQRDATRIGGV